MPKSLNLIFFNRFIVFSKINSFRFRKMYLKCAHINLITLKDINFIFTLTCYLRDLYIQNSSVTLHRLLFSCVHLLEINYFERFQLPLLKLLSTVQLFNQEVVFFLASLPTAWFECPADNSLLIRIVKRNGRTFILIFS